MNAKPLKRGRPKKDTDTTNKQLRVYTALTPAERDWLAGTYGSVWAGLQTLVRNQIAAAKK